MENTDIKIKVHYFRQLAIAKASYSENTFHTHNSLPGCHGKNPKYCKACVVAVVAIIRDAEGKEFVGVALRNPADQFNRKIGRAIAIGRANKNYGQTEFVTEPGVLHDRIKRCYETPDIDIRALFHCYLPKKDKKDKE